MASYELVEESPTHTVVKLSGQLDAAGIGAVENPLTFRVTARRRPTIVDMAGVTFVGSLAIGTLVMIAKSLRHFQAALVLESVAPPIAQALKQAGISEILPIASDRAHALQLIGVA